MFVILSYDVNEKRVGKIHKIAIKYLYPIQRSLFHGNLNSKQLARLKGELLSCIDPECDTIIIYKSNDGESVCIDEVGAASYNDTSFL